MTMRGNMFFESPAILESGEYGFELDGAAVSDIEGGLAQGWPRLA